MVKSYDWQEEMCIRDRVKLLKKIRETYPEKSIWCYTGYLYDVDLIPSGKVFTEVTQEMLSYIVTLRCV